MAGKTRRSATCRVAIAQRGGCQRQDLLLTTANADRPPIYWGSVHGGRLGATDAVTGLLSRKQGYAFVGTTEDKMGNSRLAECFEASPVRRCPRGRGSVPAWSGMRPTRRRRHSMSDGFGLR